MTLDPSLIIHEWKDTVGLTIVEVKQVSFPEYDDEATLTLIVFDNGRYAIQRDQSYYTTSCGLLADWDVNQKDNEIQKLEQE